MKILFWGVRREQIWLLCKFALAVLLIAAILSQTNLAELADALKKASPFWFGACATAFAISIVAMTTRTWELLGKQIRFIDLLTLTLAQTIVGNLVATGLGIATYLATLKSKHEMSFTKGAGVVVISRVSDLTVLGIVLFLLTLALRSSLLINIYWLLAILVATCVLVGFVITNIKSVIKTVASLIRSSWLQKFRIINNVLGDLESVLYWEKDRLYRLARVSIVYSLSSMLFSYLFFLFAIYSFSVDINPLHVLFVFLVTQIIAIIPVQILGGLGLFDITAIYLFYTFGYSDQMVVILIGVRILFYLVNIVMFAFWLGLYSIPKYINSLQKRA